MAIETRNYDIVNRSGTMWTGLFAGWFSTIGVLTVLLALGAAIGLAAIQPVVEGLPQAQEAGVAAGIWAAVSIGIACFVGAAIGTMIAGLAHKRDATSFGFTVWAGSLVGLFLLGTLVTGMMTPDVVGVGQQTGQAGQQIQQQLRGGGNLSVLQRAVDATAATSAWFVVSSALGILGGVLGGLVARHRHDHRPLVGSRRAVVRDRYDDRYADRGVMGPSSSADYPVRTDRLAPPPRSGADYRHVRDIHDDGEAY